MKTEQEIKDLRTEYLALLLEAENMYRLMKIDKQHKATQGVVVAGNIEHYKSMIFAICVVLDDMEYYRENIYVRL